MFIVSSVVYCIFPKCPEFPIGTYLETNERGVVLSLSVYNKNKKNTNVTLFSCFYLLSPHVKKVWIMKASLTEIKTINWNNNN